MLQKLKKRADIPKTEFRREYHITAKSLDMLTSLGYRQFRVASYQYVQATKTPSMAGQKMSLQTIISNTRKK